MSLFRLDWSYDTRGYRIEEETEPSSTVPVGKSIIVRNGGRQLRSEPLKIEGLWQQFADCATPNDALRFVGKHGLLTQEATEEGLESVCEILDMASHMRRVRRLVWLEDWFSVSGAFHLDPTNLAALLVQVDRDQRPELELRPRNLFEGINAQAMQEIAGGAEYRKCLNPACSEWFKVGTGQKHRSTAKYHSPSCKDSHRYAKSKESQK